MWAWHVKMATQNLLKFTHWLDWRANSKLVEVGTFANVDDEDRVGNNLLHTWELRLGNKAKLLFRLWAQGLVKVLMLKNILTTVQCRFSSWCLVMKLTFCSDFEHKVWSRFWVEVQARFWSWSLVLSLWPTLCKKNVILDLIALSQLSILLTLSTLSTLPKLSKLSTLSTLSKCQHCQIG